MSDVRRMWPLALALAGIGMLAYSGYRLVMAPDERVFEETDAVAPNDLLRGEHFQSVREHQMVVRQGFKGRVSAEGTHEIRAPEGMRVPVVRVHREHGEFVDKGEPLITLDREQVEKALTEARERKDTANIARFEHYLENVVLRAPADGQVLTIWTEIGQVPFDVGIPLVVITDRSSFSFVALVPEDVAAASANIGAKVEVELVDDLGTVTGTVTAHDELLGKPLPQVGGHVTVIVGLEEHDGIENELSGRLMLPSTKRVVGLVPRGAVRYEGDAAIVRVWEDGEVLERTVKAGGLEGDDVVIEYGIFPGDQVVVPGPRLD